MGRVNEQQARNQLESLRARRVRPEPDQSFTSLFRERAVELDRLEKRLGAIAGAWQRLCPPELLPRTSVRSLSRGVLTIGVEDAAARYELDRFLRSGAERTFIRACPTTVRKVKLVAAAPTDPPPDDPPV